MKRVCLYAIGGRAEESMRGGRAKRVSRRHVTHGVHSCRARRAQVYASERAIRPHARPCPAPLSARWLLRTQMAGRAGRPQFDKTGTCVVMTRLEQKARYERALLGTETIESHLHLRMQAALNAEIASRRYISSFDDCLTWLRGTFFFTHLPQLICQYGV